MLPNKLDQPCDHRGLGLMRESRLDSGRPVASIVKTCQKMQFITNSARSPNSSSRCVRAWFADINPSKPTPTTNPALRDRSKDRSLSALVSDVTAFLGTAAPVRSRESCGKTPHHTLDLTTCWWSASTRRHAAASGHLPHLCPGG